MPALKLLKIRVSLKGRPIKSYTFKKESIIVGRSPESDIFLDNPGVSREHFKIELNSRGYYEVQDLGSANGTFLNDETIDRETLMNNDVIRVGKFSLWINYEEDRRGEGPNAGGASPTAYEGTTVLSTTELDDLMASTREHDKTPPDIEAYRAQQPRALAKAGPSRHVLIGVVVLAFLLGTAVGAGAAWLVAG
jgi:predicted component of type VI protein secretion system